MSPMDVSPRSQSPSCDSGNEESLSKMKAEPDLLKDSIKITGK
jgi:hypothetical protein